MAPPTAGTIRLGTASPSTQPTTAATLSHLDQLARKAAASKIDILLLPEAYIGGYPRGTSFGSVMGSRSTEGRDEYLRYFRRAVDLGDTVGDGGGGAGAAWVEHKLPRTNPIPAPTTTEPTPARGDGTREALERIARSTGVFLVVGLIEKAGGSLYCAAVYICPTLGIIGKRRKVMPTGTERLVWAQGSASTLRAVSTVIRGVRINLAAAICWENYMPLVRQALYAQNVNLYLAPTADGRETWLSLMRTVGVEGRCFVVSSNMCVRNVNREARNPEDEAAAGESDDDDAQTLQDPDITAPPHQHRRRNSLLTPEGFEIALPSPFTAQRPRPTKRRQSVFDEDGNEIVLPCCDAAADHDNDEGDAVSPTTTSAGLRSRCKPFAPKHHHRMHTGAASTSASGPLASSDEFVSRGGSSIVSPFGDVLAGPQWEDDEGLIFADVDFDDCIRGRLDLDTAGSYSRNDSFKFSVQGLDLSPLPY
ncbi:carbon-nitrogen hydrolase [Cercophora scortea]|uniref:Carbon-nitrogen hydrolase n=1 Tax=Cercophora scortea TaxID=314031 RepID=A0AAE0I8Q3_9PEZI|nr:carbon-nitrogen hydrolase [Cercophora scortea]